MRRACLAMVLAAAGCGDDKGGGGGEVCEATDSQNTAGMQAFDNPDPDSGAPAVAIDTTSCPADPVPTGASTCTLFGQVKDFEDDIFKPELAGTLVKVFLGNRIDDLAVVCEPAGSTTAAACYQTTADANGAVQFDNLPCNTLVAVWANKESTVSPVTKPSAQYNYVVRDGSVAVQDVITISVQTYNIIPGIVGYAPSPELGIVAGKMRDCADDGISNINVNIINGDMTAVPADFCGTESIYRVGTFYFINEFPTKSQTSTSRDGLWAFVNVPPGSVSVFASGRRTDGGAVEAIGNTQLASFPDTITIRDITLR